MLNTFIFPFKFITFFCHSIIDSLFSAGFTTFFSFSIVVVNVVHKMYVLYLHIWLASGMAEIISRKRKALFRDQLCICMASVVNVYELYKSSQVLGFVTKL
jgi:hypothetical protein